MAIEPYKINDSDTAIGNLKRGVLVIILPDKLDGVGWDMDAPLDDIRRLMTIGNNQFD